MYHSIDQDFIFYEAKSLFYDCLCNTETDLVKLQFSWKAISSVVSSVRDPSSESESCSVVSDSLRPHGLYSPWNSPGQNTEVGSLSFSRDSSQPRDRTQVSCILGRILTSWGTIEASCAIKKTEHRRTDAFKLWCWRRLLRGSWTARRSNQSILKEIKLEYSLEELMLKLKLQYFGHLNTKSQLTGKDFDAGKEWGQEQKGVTEDEMVGWHHRFNGHEFEHTQELVKDREAWFVAVHVISKSWTWLTDWTTKTC